jgi:hypothetical protein
MFELQLDEEKNKSKHMRAYIVSVSTFQGYATCKNVESLQTYPNEYARSFLWSSIVVDYRLANK